MNRIIVSLSLLFFTAVILLPPVCLQADNLRAPNSPSFTQNSPGTTLNQMPKNRDIKDIIGLVELKKPVPYLIYGAATLLIIFLIVLSIFLLKRKKAKPPELPNPAKLALAALANAESRLKETGTTFFAAEISSILRSYIQQRFMIPSTKQTTSEFFSQLKTSSVNGKAKIATHRENLEKCLSLCDLAKYAHFLPEQNAANNLSETVREFINTTRTEKEMV